MKNKFLTGLLIALVCLLAIAIGEHFIIGKLQKENTRVTGNNHVLEHGISSYKTTDSLKAITIGALNLENKEIKEFYTSKMIDVLKTMDIKLKNVERYTAMNLEAKYKIRTLLRDSIHFTDSLRIDTLKWIDYQSKWIDFYQLIYQGESNIEISTRDSISIVQHWQRPHKFLFIKYGKKQHFEDFKNANPYSHPTFMLYIDKTAKK